MQKFFSDMWKYTSIDGEIITGNRQEIAEYLNIHGDIYDDEYWDVVIQIHHIEEIE